MYFQRAALPVMAVHLLTLEHIDDTRRLLSRIPSKRNVSNLALDGL